MLVRAEPGKKERWKPTSHLQVVVVLEISSRRRRSSWKEWTSCPPEQARESEEARTQDDGTRGRGCLSVEARSCPEGCLVVSNWTLHYLSIVFFFWTRLAKQGHRGPGGERALSKKAARGGVVLGGRRRKAKQEGEQDLRLRPRS